MAFHVPDFNLTANIWHAVPTPPALPVGAPNIAALPCNLRIMKTADTITSQGSQPTAFLSVPAGSDLRVSVGWRSILSPPGNAPIAEVPAGSGRIYQIWSVDDVAKGYPNEYRFAVLVQIDATSGPPLP